MQTGSSAAVLERPAETVGLTSADKPQIVKKSRLPALSGLRAFAALNIVFYHFSNPKWFGPFAPIVDNGYTSVSFFLLMSGFILAYNYSDRAQRGQLSAGHFWVARLSRLYPVYVLGLLVSMGMLVAEWQVRTHGEFVLGVTLTPLLLQGWVPKLATFWNTPAWTMCTEAFFYLIFPVVVCWKRPRHWRGLIALLFLLWVAGLFLPTLYTVLQPDGPHPGRYTDSFWMRALKFSPPPHVPSFLFGIVLADVDARISRESRYRLLLGLAGVAALYTILYYGDHMPFALMHDGLLMPLFGMSILGLAGHNLIARFFGFWPFVAVGQASYCLYILHFNLWELIHNSHLLERLHLIALDPWISYCLLVAAALLAMRFIEKPTQKWIRGLVREKA
ncbi:acyltransferase [Acidobacterium sp. S8]|uniref:acyltransferase family protein n=1 Tax=Acidobacterium sp. S8 TaxID=1641854 RepID=UPI00131B2D4E|nr:acyltransferase [Acidobacterium sp. S8]